PLHPVDRLGEAGAEDVAVAVGADGAGGLVGGGDAAGDEGVELVGAGAYAGVDDDAGLGAGAVVSLVEVRGAARLGQAGLGGTVRAARPDLDVPDDDVGEHRHAAELVEELAHPGRRRETGVAV